MQNLYFLSNWEKDRKRTWSGTNWGIYNALKDKCDVIDVDLSTVANSLAMRIARKLRLVPNADCGLWLNNRLRKYVERKIHPRGKVFQFAEIIDDTDALSTYIYQDLSVDYICHMRDNLPETFKVSGFGSVDVASLIKRQEIQNHYYETCAGVFCMGHWFAKDLIERTGVNPNKVHAVGGGLTWMRL